MSGLEPQEALRARQVPVLVGSQVPQGQGETQGYAGPYRRRQGESIPPKRRDQAPEAQVEPQAESLVNQAGGPKEECVRDP